MPNSSVNRKVFENGLFEGSVKKSTSRPAWISPSPPVLKTNVCPVFNICVFIAGHGGAGGHGGQTAGGLEGAWFSAVILLFWKCVLLLLILSLNFTVPFISLEPSKNSGLKPSFKTTGTSSVKYE